MYPPHVGVITFGSRNLVGSFYRKTSKSDGEMMKVFYPVKAVPTEAAGRKKNTKDVDMADKMFNEIAPKYADRNGGYTRIIKIGPRKGDAAMEVVLELV